ncbi:MAG: hypothetical protein V1756_01650 [Patescibacteria group bacterium]
MKQKQKNYFIFGILILLISFLVFAGITPAFKLIQKNSGEFSSQRSLMILMENEMESLELIRENYQDYAPNLEKIDSLFINREAPIEFIRFLEKIASDNSVSIAITPSMAEESVGQSWSEMYFQLSASGSSLHFLRFLDKLQNSIHLIEIKSISVQSKEVPGDIDASLTIKVLAK